MHFLIFLKMVVETCQDNFFLHMLPGDIFQNLMTVLHPQTSPQFFIMLLSRIKNNSLHILVEICQAIHLMCMLAKNVFKDSTKVFCVWFSFFIIRLLAILLFIFMLIGLEMHLGSVNIVFLKILSTVEKSTRLNFSCMCQIETFCKNQSGFSSVCY